MRLDLLAQLERCTHPVAERLDLGPRHSPAYAAAWCRGCGAVLVLEHGQTKEKPPAWRLPVFLELAKRSDTEPPPELPPVDVLEEPAPPTPRNA